MTDSASFRAPRVAVVLLAGGLGRRAAFSRPKQLEMLGRKSILQWSLDCFAAHPNVAGGILVAAADVAAALPALPPGWQIAPPGDERQQSVANALQALRAWDADSLILVHDAARPGITTAMIDRTLAGLQRHVAVIPTLAVPDTLIERDGPRAGGAVDRSRLARVQTPQGFHLGVLRRAHEEASGSIATDDAQLVQGLGIEVHLIEGDPRLHKLTYAEDMAILSALLVKEAAMRIAVGMGYDVHRLVTGKPLWLGGMEIAHSHGLDGHSDADVALHALTDAIFGALAEGDIGDHFPPSDPQWRGAASDQFLAYAARRVSDRSGHIDHLDLTIIAEAPKIGPHRAAMQARIAQIANISPSRVSVKATTSERLGFTGRREGIAAQAVATLKLPEN
ncbi:2-C-methyl-D-erythritol 2,4-cyclodiphosphate synthase [Sphingopyxis sp. MWB1]|uniref:2-C-methyl-D-erythritol 2,4-cyclodiphosphate synthase n=1 Tax=Sphingopyxis sp. MWB1 TaxID=1537715 RepID=UPI00051A2168|nr:2-C-methyl-D-erythritol 2,4-cyclodiphosphate synthase [Sphingopyxis sp. MWB1]